MVEIDKKEVLRYLGYRGQDLDEGLSVLIDQISADCLEQLTPRYVYAVFDVSFLETGIALLGTNILLEGEDIRRHLARAQKCAVLASTLGVGSEKKLFDYERRSMTEALIYDSCCTALVESVTDACELEIVSLAKKEGYRTNARFSPGYGDLPLELQPKILSVLGAEKKIGLTVTENNLLIPRKSVTALVGFLERGENNV